MTPEAAIAEEATAVVVTVVAAINATGPPGSRFCGCDKWSLDPFQTVSGISLELLESAAFPFASGSHLQYLMT
jgi:hypothetical protein